MPVKEKKQKKDDFLHKDIALPIGGTGLKEKALLAKNLAIMQRSGITILDSLQIIVESSSGRMKKIMKKVFESVQAGNSLADSFALYPKVFSGIFISSIYAGESSGTLAQNLENLAEQLRKEQELITKVRGAMLYPIVVLIASFFLGMAMSFLVLPKIIPLFKGLGTELPWTTKALISFSEFVELHGFWLFWGIFFVTVFFVWLLRQKFSHPVTHWFMLRIPIIKTIVKNTNLARFCRVLSTLLQSGLTIEEALEVTSEAVGNQYYQKSLVNILDRVQKGTTLAENLEFFPKLYPIMTIKMIRVGEEAGNTSGTLEYLANFYEVEVDTSTKTLATAVEPILLLLIGLVVGFLALSIITPIYNITGNIGAGR